MRRKNITNQNLTEEEENHVQVELLKQQILECKKDIDNNILKIGENLCIIKELLPHGQWGEWLEKNVDYTPRTAQRYIKAFNLIQKLPEELDSKMCCVGGTKLIELSSCKIDVVEDIVRNNDIDNMSVIELKKIIKDKKTESKPKKKKNDINVAFEIPKELRRETNKYDNEEKLKRYEIESHEINIETLKKELQKEIDEIEDDEYTQQEKENKVRELKEEFAEMIKEHQYKTIDINNDDKIYDDTLYLYLELKNRVGSGEKIEATLVARYKAGEIKHKEFIDCIYRHELDIPIFLNEKSQDDFFEWADNSDDYYSEYEQYNNKNTYYSIFNNEFEWNEAIKDFGNGKDESSADFTKSNHIDNKKYQLAFVDDENTYHNLIIYKDYKIIGVFADGTYENIKTLKGYHNSIQTRDNIDDEITNNDLKELKKLFTKLQKQMDEYYKREDIRQTKQQKENEKQQKAKQKYEEAKNSWTMYYQPYCMGKYKFEDIWDENGEVKNFNLWSEMIEFCNKQSQSKYNDYSDLFGTKTIEIKEEDKDIYKTIYRSASLKLHPDILKDDGHAMQILNDLKESWGI